MTQKIKTKQLPKGWKIKSFKDCFKSFSPTNKIKKRNYSRKGNLPIVDQGENLIAGYITDDSKKQEGDKPFIIFGDHTRRFKFVDFDFVAGADGIKILKVNDFLDPKFIYYQCLTLDFPNKGYSRHFQYVKKSFLKFPESLQQQTKIVQEIEKQFTRLDASVKDLKNTKEKLEVYGKSVLKKAFAVNGKIFKIKDICKLINGRAFKPTEWSKEGIPIIRIQNLKNLKIKHNYCDFEVDKKYYVNNGDLLFAWSGTPGTSFGAHIWNSGKAVLNQHIFKIDLNEDIIDKDYFLHILNKSVNEFIGKAHGTAGLAHITKGKFENHEINIPQKKQQTQIVQEIEKQFSIIDKLEQTVNNLLNKTEQLRKSILKSAFEGKLVKPMEINN